MASKATRMNGELLELAQGRIPGTRDWVSEIHLEKTPPRGSWNKYLVCNACELLYSRLTNKVKRTNQCIAWWGWYSTQTVCGAESLTPEEIYRAMMVYSIYIAAAATRAAGNIVVAEALLKMVRAHVAWLVLGAGAGPGKRVQNHHLGDVGKPCVLWGDGVAIWALPYIAQAGARGWVRNRDAGPKNFLFTESVVLSALVGQAAAYNVPAKNLAWETAMFAAASVISPGIAPLGFGDSDRVQLREFLRNTFSLAAAAPVVAWVANYPPMQPHVFIRYADSSVITYMKRSGHSSTDPRMIDCWFAGGKTAKTSGDDGLRSSSPAQIAWETPMSVACSALDHTSPTMEINKPASPEVYRIVSQDGVVVLTNHGVPSPVPATPVTPYPPHSVPPPRRRGFWARLRALLGGKK